MIGRDPGWSRPSQATKSGRGALNELAIVILVKVDVYDAAFEALRDAGIAVVDERIPFPSTGRQTEFAKTRNPRVAVGCAPRGRYLY
jgi:hypothetical protein